MARRKLSNYTPEQSKFFNKINWRIRQLVSSGKVSADEMIETLSDIEGVELVEKTNAFTLSRATKLTSDVMKALEEYVSKPSKFSYDKSKFYTSLLKHTVDDYYEFMNSTAVMQAIEEAQRAYMVDKGTAKDILGLSDIGSLMSDWGRAYRNHDKSEVNRIKEELVDLIVNNAFYGGQLD